MSTGVGMSACCLSGKVHDGTPSGKVEIINNLQTYVAAPKDGSNVKTIVFITDSEFCLPMAQSQAILTYLQFLDGSSRMSGS